ncbi:MAG: chemotaxis protein CheW [Planctomycetes bacterium]|nr:chemotaxis protein CheW [Planctomycetota bacterium]
MDDLVREFLIESRESLDQLDLTLIELEKQSHDVETLASIFRTVHTIKGTAGFFGFTMLEELTHVGETLLGKLRDEGAEPTPEMISALLELGDALRAILETIENTGAEGAADYGDLAATLERLHAGEDAPEGSPDDSAEPENETVQEGVSLGSDAEPGADSANAPEDEGSSASNATSVTETASKTAEKTQASVAETTVRVDVSLLDSLMNQVGELVLARNQILQYTATASDPDFITTTQRLNLITSELQEGVMKTRMQPIGSVWSKFPRVVRDLSRTLQKDVSIEMEGEDTELDRTIIEAIKDPLTHIIRNAVDHGLERPADRLSAGKPSTGHLRLCAFHEGGQVNIVISDDGAGIDPEKVKAKAVERHVISEQQASRMSDREALGLIFAPGFSTASAVTNISGRGVGMDVVKTNIEKIGGSVDVQSSRGVGTTLRVKIPLTLAIIPALVVECGGESFAIPQVCLLELVRLEGEAASRAIETIHDIPVHRLRGKLLPLVWLGEQLKIAKRTPPSETGVLCMAVLQAENRQFGLIVDDIRDNQEIVVKPLGNILQGLSCFAGATIMGDGRVALIIDALGIAMKSGIVTETGEADAAEILKSADEERERSISSTYLLFELGESKRMATPLTSLSRIEEFEHSAIEYVGSRRVVQYRGSIMELLSLADFLGVDGAEPDPDLPLQVLAYTDGERFLGFLVGSILDIVEAPTELDSSDCANGITGVAIMQGKVTQVVDLQSLFETAARRTQEPVTCS